MIWAMAQNSSRQAHDCLKMKYRKMKNIKSLILGALMLSSVVGYAQQDPMFTQYMFNTLSVNPAYAGSADLLTATAIYRSQWVKFDGAPKTQSVIIHGPLKKESLSLGGSIINDAHGPVKQTGVYLDFAYRIFFDKAKLSFGLKGGLNLFQANLLELNPVDSDDPTFANDISRKPLPNFGFGMLWHAPKYYVGVSTPKLLSNKLLDGDIPDFENNTERQHFFFIAGYVMDVNAYTKFKPTLLVKGVSGAPISIDVTANFLFYEKFWIGAMYRHQDALGLLLQYEVNRKVKIGYSYDYTLSDIGDFQIYSCFSSLYYNCFW